MGQIVVLCEHLQSVIIQKDCLVFETATKKERKDKVYT